MKIALFLICVFLTKKITSQHEQMCDFSNRFSCSEDGNKPLNEICSSTNFCIKDKNFQVKTLPQCPENFLDANDFCYILSEKSKFPPKCPFENTLPFDIYKNIIFKDIIDPVWIPARRNTQNGLLLWMESSKRYKTVFDDFFVDEGTIKDKHCLLYYNSSYTGTVSCEEKHSSVCAYQKLDQLKNPLCSGENVCHPSGLSAKSKCFCLESSQNGTIYPKAEFLEPYQNNVYGMLTNQRCTIGLEKSSNGTFVWASSHKILDYSFWSPDSVFESNYTYVEATPSGWILTQEPSSCILIEKEIQKVSPHLELNYDTENSFALTVSSFIGLKEFDLGVSVYCFTTANPLYPLYRYSTLNVIMSTAKQIVYEFELFQNSSGNYWCEGFQYNDSKLIRSNTLYLEAYKSIRRVKSFPAEATTPPPFCLSEVNDNLTWPQTPTGSSTSPKEYCFTPDGQLLVRQCEDNGQWGPIDTCQIMDSTSVITLSFEFLLDSSIAYGSYEKGFQEFHDFTLHYDVFTALDVYLSYEIIETYTRIWDSDHLVLNNQERFVDIVNNLLNIDDSILKESQLKALGTQSLLSSINQAFSYDQFSGVINPIEKTNFVVLPNCDGLIVQNSQISKIDKVNAIDDIIATENFESAIWAAESETRVDMYIYFNDKFFPSEPGTLPYVYSSIYNYRNENDFEVYVIYKFDDSKFTNDFKCLYAAFNTLLTERLSSWTEAGELQIYQSCFVCKFLNMPGFYTLLPTPIATTTTTTTTVATTSYVTDSLMDILTNTSNSSEVLSKLSQITSSPDEFTSSDIFLVGQILKKISNTTVDDLELLGEIVTNLQKFDKNILSESQEDNNATDTILYCIDTIVRNYEFDSSFQVITEGFITVGFDLSTIDFSGFVILNENKIEILYGPVNTSSLLEYKDLDSALVISEELKNQMQDSKVAVNIFANSTLFNEKKQSFKYTIANKIVDVLFPEMESNFSGPVSIFHEKKEERDGQECTFWFYDNPNRIPGRWKNDSRAKMFSSLIRCDFWHTTHFGVLLFDEDKYENLVAIEWITNINSALSLLGFFGIIFTAYRLQPWRTKLETKILLSLVVSGILQIIVFFVTTNVDLKSKSHGLCIFSGFLLHYSVLVQFLWMLITAVLQYRLIVLNQTRAKDLTTHLLLKTNLFAWGAALLPVIVVVAVDGENYASGNAGICYPSGYALYFGVWWPISVIVVINLIIFMFIVDSLVNRRKKIGEPALSDETLFHTRRIALYFVIFGLTWIFGFLAEMTYSIIFVYFFEILATLQGVALFFLYVVSNKNVREMYYNKNPLNQVGNKKTSEDTNKSSRLGSFLRRYKIFQVSNNK